MKIAKSILVDPAGNGAYGTFAIAASFFVFAYSELFGKIAILLYYALWLPLVFVDYRRALGNYIKYYWIFAFAIFACLSVFWSQAPSVTLRAAVQYLSHVICTLIVARTISPRTFSRGALAGVFLVIIYSLAFGRYLYDPLDGTYSLVGVFSSKNQLGLFASLGVFFSFCTLFVLHERRIVRAAAGLVAALSGYALFACQSATSVISIAAVLALLVGVSVIMRLSLRNRSLILIACLVLAAAIAVAAINAGAVDVLLGAFNKDTTLTGRTYLWAQGMLASQQAPVVGVGYQAYWVQGFPEPERLWEEFYIAARTGFHFHNTYIETLVELGGIGVLLISLVLVRVIIGHTRRLMTERSDPAAQMMLGIGVLLLVRSFVEVDVIAPYQVGSFLLFYAAALIATPHSAALRMQTQKVPAPRRPLAVPGPS